MARAKPVFTWPTLTLLALLVLPPTLAVHTFSPPLLRHLALAYAVTVNATTFVVYRHDKEAARGGRGWRVRETSLHLWALAGGWPGAFVAQRVLRHKTRSHGFLAVFWATVVGHELLCLRVLGLL